MRSVVTLVKVNSGNPDFWKEWQFKSLSTKRGDMKTTYNFFRDNSMQTKNGKVHFGMLGFLYPFGIIEEETSDGVTETALKFETIDVNHNTCNTFRIMEIANNTENEGELNPVDYASGHEVDMSKEFQLVFWQSKKVSSHAYHLRMQARMYQ